MQSLNGDVLVWKLASAMLSKRPSIGVVVVGVVVVGGVGDVVVGMDVVVDGSLVLLWYCCGIYCGCCGIVAIFPIGDIPNRGFNCCCGCLLL